MSEPTSDQAAAPSHTYQITHYVKADGGFGGREMILSGEHSAEEAIAWIRQHMAGSRDASLHLADSAQETQTPAGEGNDQADTSQAGSVDPDAAGPDGPAGP